MPNGGLMPCCRVCKWSRTLDPISQVQCTRHELEIVSPHYTFCADLAGDPGLEAFISKNSIKTGIVYQWIETAYQDLKYPTIPQYHHEYSELVPIQEYPDYSSRMGPVLRQHLESLKVEQQKHQKRWWQFWR